VKVRQGKSMTRARDVEFDAAGVGKHYDDDRRIAAVSISGNVIDDEPDAAPDAKPTRVRIEIEHDDPMLPVYVDALVAMRDRVLEGSAAPALPSPPLRTRLRARLPRDSWKLSARLSQAEAATKTSGSTQKFMNGDYWVLGEHGLKPEGGLPIGTTAVYYKDSVWWIVEKVK
jgi:hypothetical protein